MEESRLVLKRRRAKINVLEPYYKDHEPADDSHLDMGSLDQMGQRSCLSILAQGCDTGAVFR